MAVTREEVIQFIENMTRPGAFGFHQDPGGQIWRSGSNAHDGGCGAAGAAPAAAAEPVEEQTEFNVILTGYEADKKIQVIKVVRAITSFGLRKPKTLSKACPSR